jgi:hypothetical protein
MFKYKLIGVDSFEMVIDENSIKSKDGFIVLPNIKAVEPFIERGILEKVEKIEIETKANKNSKKKNKRKKGDK